MYNRREYKKMFSFILFIYLFKFKDKDKPILISGSDDKNIKLWDFRNIKNDPRDILEK